MSNYQEEIQKIADATKYEAAQVHTIANQIAKGATTHELIYFLNVARSVGLNPFNKEIWGYKDNKGNFLVFTGRDGFLRKAQENSNYAGMRSSEVCKKDKFITDIPNGKITHHFESLVEDNRGTVLGAYAIVFRKDGEPTIEVVAMKDYCPQRPSNYSPWHHKPAEMIKKVAESHALKKAFGITGVNFEGDWSEKNGIVTPVKAEVETISEEEKRVRSYIENCDDVRKLQEIDPEILTKYELHDLVSKKINNITTKAFEDET